VPLDEAAAAEAITACHRTAVAVDVAAVARLAAAVGAQVQWRGPARDSFDERLAGIQAEAAALADDLRSTAGTIARAVEAQRAEQRRRGGP
jgi:hypothetical protein